MITKSGLKVNSELWRAVKLTMRTKKELDSISILDLRME